MRRVVLWGLAIALWVGSVVAWGIYADAHAELLDLGPTPSNAEIYPVENRMLLGFALGIVLSFVAMIFAAVAARRVSS